MWSIRARSTSDGLNTLVYQLLSNIVKNFTLSDPLQFAFELCHTSYDHMGAKNQANDESRHCG